MPGDVPSPVGRCVGAEGLVRGMIRGAPQTADFSIRRQMLPRLAAMCGDAARG